MCVWQCHDDDHIIHYPNEKYYHIINDDDVEHSKRHSVQIVQLHVIFTLSSSAKWVVT